MQCGPAPLAAIKKGHIYIGYDTGFVFAEVNADRVEWIVKQVGTKNYIKGPVHNTLAPKVAISLVLGTNERRR